jgi:hypothetical protein
MSPTTSSRSECSMTRIFACSNIVRVIIPGASSGKRCEQRRHLRFGRAHRDTRTEPADRVAIEAAVVQVRAIDGHRQPELGRRVREMEVGGMMPTTSRALPST